MFRNMFRGMSNVSLSHFVRRSKGPTFCCHVIITFLEMYFSCYKDAPVQIEITFVIGEFVFHIQTPHTN